MTDEDEKTWHLKKEITIGHIFTTLSVATAMMFYAGRIENRLSISELRVDHLEEYNKEVQGRLDLQFGKIDQTLNRIEDKIDKKADKK